MYLLCECYDSVLRDSESDLPAQKTRVAGLSQILPEALSSARVCQSRTVLIEWSMSTPPKSRDLLSSANF